MDINYEEIALDCIALQPDILIFCCNWVHDSFDELAAMNYWLNCLLSFLIQVKKDTYFIACDRVGKEKITY
jgi:hypothetical protein